MATKRKPTVGDAISRTFEERGLKKAPEEMKQENMKTRSFQMKDSEYDALKQFLDDEMGMKIGQGIRFILHQFIKEKIQ